MSEGYGSRSTLTTILEWFWFSLTLTVRRRLRVEGGELSAHKGGSLIGGDSESRDLGCYDIGGFDG